jgi:hypothetical protein
MDSDIKRQWIEALRSGKYQQGKFALRTVDNEFCCLGVLCDIVRPDGWSDTTVESDVAETDVYEFVEGKDTYEGALPDGVGEAVGIDLWARHDVTDELIEMNDKGTPFAEIADYIEANL